MLVALGLPKLLDRISDRPVLITGAALLAIATGLTVTLQSYVWLIALWFLIGAGYSLAQTPTGRLLRRSSHAEDRPAVFAAQFALSHACWMVTYPLAGWAGVVFGLPAASVILGFIAGCATLSAAWLWPSTDEETVEHSHEGLPSQHPHWEQGSARGRNSHAHVFVIDDLHATWPHFK